MVIIFEGLKCIWLFENLVRSYYLKQLKHSFCMILKIALYPTSTDNEYNNYKYNITRVCLGVLYIIY